jgi:hypothetical protein
MLEKRFCEVLVWGLQKTGPLCCSGRRLSISVPVSVPSVLNALLKRAHRLLSGFVTITLVTERACPWDEMNAWFRGRTRWCYLMGLRGVTENNSTAAPLGCQVRRLLLARGEGRVFRGVRIWGNWGKPVNLVVTHPHRIAGGGSLVPDTPLARSGLGLRPALLLPTVVLRSEIWRFPAREQWSAGTRAD